MRETIELVKLNWSLKDKMFGILFLSFVILYVVIPIAFTSLGYWGCLFCFPAERSSSPLHFLFFSPYIYVGPAGGTGSEFSVAYSFWVE